MLDTKNSYYTTSLKNKQCVFLFRCFNIPYNHYDIPNIKIKLFSIETETFSLSLLHLFLHLGVPDC